MTVLDLVGMRFFADAQNDRTKHECVILKERRELKNLIHTRVVLYILNGTRAILR